MLDLFIKIVFYVGAGLVLLGSVAWYLNAAYVELSGKGELVIAPFRIAESGDAKDGSRGEALARMLRASLEKIEHDLAVSQQTLVDSAAAGASASPAPAAPAAESITSIAPPLFVAQRAGLQTRLLEPAQVKLAVAGVDVGVIIPWLQRTLTSRRTLALTYYQKSKSVVVVSGSLHSMGLEDESLRLEVPIESGGAADLDLVAWTVATEIERRRLARDPTNRVDLLNTAEFGELVAVLNDTARLNLQAARGRAKPEQFAALLGRIDRLAGEVPHWHQLQLLAASIAESARLPDRAVTFLRNAEASLQAQLASSDHKDKKATERELARVTAKLKATLPPATRVAAIETGDALTKIRADAQRATTALNQLFKLELEPLPVELLPVHEANAYSDLKKYFAPPAVAQLPDITWHNMTWQYLNRYVPVFNSSSPEAQAVLYSYSDVLPVAIRQLGLVESPDPASWDAYAGGVAWIRAATEQRDFKLGDDRRPLRSLAHPGKAYTDPVIGDDPQIANYKDLKKRAIEVHSASGIGSKAFYEAAQSLGVRRATDLWLLALPCLSKEKSVDYPAWASCLLAVAGDADRPKMLQALQAVGLDGARAPATPTAPVTSKRKQASRKPVGDPAVAGAGVPSPPKPPLG